MNLYKPHLKGVFAKNKRGYRLTAKKGTVFIISSNHSFKKGACPIPNGNLYLKINYAEIPQLEMINFQIEKHEYLYHS